MEDEVLVDVNPPSTFLLAEGDQPVWPVRNDNELEAIRQAAGLFGINTRVVHGLPVAPKRRGSREKVIAVGRSWTEDAALYAHLTGRSCEVVDDIEALRSRRSVAVVITAAEHLHEELFEELLAPNRRAVVGLICGYDVESVRLQVLTRSIASFAVGPLNLAHIEFAPPYYFPSIVSETRQFLTGAATPAERSQALGSSAGLLDIYTHSDGIDAFLGPNLTLCPMSSSVRGDADRAPRCLLTGLCHRTRTGIQTALATSELITPKVISARIMLWNVCWGTLSSVGNWSKMIDGAWGLFPQMSRSATIGAIITTWKIVALNHNVTRPLTRSLLKGMPVGRALHRFHTSTMARRQGVKFCLLGDPRARLPRTANSIPCPPFSVQPKTLQKKRSLAIAELAFLRAWLVEAAERSAEKDFNNSRQTALQLIQRHEKSLWRGADLEQSETIASVMRVTLLRHIVTYGTAISQDWMRCSEALEMDVRSKPCFVCGCRAEVLRSKFRNVPAIVRRIRICPRCGLIEDAPLKSDVGMSHDFKKNIFRLRGSLPQRNWVASLVMRSSLDSDYVSWPWPKAPSGEPVHVFQAPRPWPVGPLIATFILLWNTSLTLLSMPLAGGGRVVANLQDCVSGRGVIK